MSKAVIYIIVQRAHEYTVRNFTDAWGRKLRGRVDVLNYDEFAYARRLPRATYIFADHDRLSDEHLELATAVADRLEAAGCKVLSHPGRALRRTQFLNALNDAGINDFRALNVNAGLPDDIRFPVFLRLADDHAGPKTGLLNDRAELDAAIESSPHKGDPHLIAVEFCDTRDNGTGPYRKYAAMRVADKLIPRHCFASEGWMTKVSDTVDPNWIEFEADYFDHFQERYAADVMKVFELAGIQYGRLDFAVTNGRVRAWEINSNPMLVSTPDVIDARRIVKQGWSAKQIVDGLSALDDPSPPDAPPVPIHLDTALRRRGGETAGEALGRIIGKALYRLRRLPGVPSFWANIERAEWLARR
jgi:hypothetical protein